LHAILQKKICFDASEKFPTCGKQYSCNHCIHYFKRKFVLMHHKISLHEENSNLYLPPPEIECGKQYSCHHCIYYFKRKFVLMHHKMAQDEKNTILAITAYNTSTENSF